MLNEAPVIDRSGNKFGQNIHISLKCMRWACAMVAWLLLERITRGKAPLYAAYC